MRAAWKPSNVVYKGHQISLLRGQLAWSIRDMAKGCGCSIQEIRTALKHLKFGSMLRTEQHPGGNTAPLIVTILKYNDYQSSIKIDNTEHNTEHNTETNTRATHEPHTSHTQNNKEKKYKKDKEYKNLMPERFEEFWENYPRKVGKPKAIASYRAALKRASAEEIIAGATAYANLCRRDHTEAKFIKHPQGWLSDDRWKTVESESASEHGSLPPLPPGAVRWANGEPTHYVDQYDRIFETATGRHVGDAPAI